jgi:hypothetical protein
LGASFIVPLGAGEAEQAFGAFEVFKLTEAAGCAAGGNDWFGFEFGQFAIDDYR